MDVIKVEDLGELKKEIYRIIKTCAKEKDFELCLRWTLAHIDQYIAKSRPCTCQDEHKRALERMAEVIE